MNSSKDVARKAGVSQSTVSRVLNNPESVKPATKEKVLKAMVDLRYYPNLIARSLVTNSTKTIALISGTLKNGFFVETTDSIVNLAKNKGFKTMVYFGDENQILDYLEPFLGNKVDGILLSPITLDDPIVEKIEQSSIPCVYFNRRPREGGNYVVLDNFMAAQMLTRHLLDLGHRKIAYISGETNVSTFFERKIGFTQVMKEANVEIQPELTYFIRTSDEEVEKLTFKLMHRNDPPTAIICATDTMALACMNTVLAMGKRIPEDVSIAGIDDIRMASHQAVQLTTVGHQKFAMGEIAAEMLIEMIRDRGVSQDLRQITLKPELVIRKTTAPLG